MKRFVCLLVALTVILSGFSFSVSALEESHVTRVAVADTYVQGGDKNKDLNFGTSDLIVFKASVSDSVDRRVYLTFDISDLSADDISNAKINLYRLGGEGSSEKIPVRAFEISGFDENTVVFTDPILLKKVVGVGYYSGWKNEWVTVDITEFVKSEIQKGTKKISVGLYDRFQANKRIDFSSREGSNPPYLDIKYGGTPDPIEPLDDGLGFSGATEDTAIENAKQLLKKSNAVYKNPSSLEKEIEKTGENEYTIRANADSYIRGGDYADKSHGYEDVLYIKNNVYSMQEIYKRHVFLKFDISAAGKNTVGGAFLKLYPVLLEGSNSAEFSVYSVADTSWDEKTLTWNNAPEIGSLITSFNVEQTGKYSYVDLTGYINEKAAEGLKYISICIKDDNNKNKIFQFSSIQGQNSPYLILSGIGDTLGSVPLPVETEPDDDYEYISVGVNHHQKPYTNYVQEKTRVLSSLTDFTPVSENPAVSQYGGLLSVQCGATGYFYTKEVNGRWWMIDPLGHPLFNFGFNTVSKPSTEHEIAGMERRYGTVENWANSVSELFKSMNVHGMTAPKEVRDMMNEKVPYFSSISCIGPYGNAKGMVTYSGSTVFKDNVMPVFDPSFEVYVDKKVSAAANSADDKYLMGWFSDNEISVAEDMLENYLKQDPEDERYIYSYYAAWEWLKERHGENATIEDITAVDKDDWREYVFDRYYSLVSAAFKKYDPNHMYLGSRLNGSARTCEGIFKAAGRYLDAISFNYYGTWTPRKSDMDNWYKWSGKPFIVTECYTKGMDASEKIPGLTNESGAGWIVATQEDRGHFYQNYSLALIESKTCIGFQWYKYQDNDPDGKNNDPSNLNANKGIVDRDFNDYPELIEKMTELNQNVFALAKYFDSKNAQIGETFEYSEKVINDTDSKKECFMMLALYKTDTKELVSVTVGNPYVIGAGNSVNVTCKAENLPDMSDGKYYIKSFIWDDISKLGPIISSKVVK